MRTRRPLVSKGRNALALVLGSRGLGDFAGLLLGSVSLAVAARADCPVVVVRGGAEYRDAQFGSIVVGVEDGEGSGTADLVEPHLVRAFSSVTGRGPYTEHISADLANGVLTVRVPKAEKARPHRVELTG